MTIQDIDNKVREYFQSLLAKCKTPEDRGKAVDKAIDLYFELKKQNQQLELF